MEAEKYLATGHDVEKDFQSSINGRLGDVAKVWQPSRLKGIQVGSKFGTPFLAATQVFDMRPVPRKWLALERTQQSNDRFVTPGTIVVTCSGSVGRATATHSPHEGILLSHDLLRVDPKNELHRGWIYAYLRASSVRKMMVASKYGHIIKHLEVSHLEALPMPVADKSFAARCNKAFEEILQLRNRANFCLSNAEELFEVSLGSLPYEENQEMGFSISSSMIFNGRRRLDALPHNPRATKIKALLKEKGSRVMSLQSCGLNVWLPGRFKRTPAEVGVNLIDSSKLFEINPDIDRVIADGNFGDPHNGRVQPGWILLARSGQIYGINGMARLVTESLLGHVISDDAIRIAPSKNCSIDTGYLYVAMSHPSLGRPLVKSVAYGSSIPHIDTADVLSLPIVRLKPKLEAEIAKLANEAFLNWGKADILETALAASADEYLQSLLTTVSHRKSVQKAEKAPSRNATKRISNAG